MDQPKLVTVLNVVGIMMTLLVALGAVSALLEGSPYCIAMAGGSFVSALVLFALGAVVEKLAQIEFHARVASEAAYKLAVHANTANSGAASRQS